MKRIELLELLKAELVGYINYVADVETKCPVCQRGDIWQEAINRAEYVYNNDGACEDLVKGQEVIDYVLAEVSVMLEQANVMNEPRGK